MPLGVQAEIRYPPRLRGGISTHVMTQQIVSEKKVARVPGDLFGRPHRIGRMLNVENSIGPMRAQIFSGHVVGAGPNPKIPPVRGRLIRQENPGKQRKRARSSVRLGLPQPINMGPPGR